LIQALVGQAAHPGVMILRGCLGGLIRRACWNLARLPLRIGRQWAGYAWACRTLKTRWFGARCCWSGLASRTAPRQTLAFWT